MKSFRKELWFDIPGKRAFVNITPQVESCLRESGVREGLLLCNAMHITASVFINDDEAVSTKIMNGGWSSSRPTSRSRSTYTTGRGRTTGTRT